MSAQRYQIVPKTAYSIISGAGTITLDIGPRAIPAQDWRSGSLLVNLFSVSGPSTNSIAVNLINACIGPDNPNVRFTSSTALASVNFTSLTGVPAALSQNFSGGVAEMVAVQVVVSGGISGTMNFTIEVQVEGQES